jgi:TnpA family transposase
MRGVSAHEIYTAGNKHADARRIHKASADVINAFAKLDVARMWGDGQAAAVDGSQIETWEKNLLAESSIRYGGFDGIAFRLISDTYIALFSHFIPCGVWEAVVHPGLAAGQRVRRPARPDPCRYPRPEPACLRARGVARVRAAAEDTELARPQLLPGPDATTKYGHIDALFGDNVIDWALIEKHWPDLLRAGISIREGRLSSVTPLRRLGNHSRRNRLYKALRELDRVIRTITLLRYLSEPGLRDQLGAITNRTEQFHNFARFLMIGGRLIGHNDPDYQERVVKFNELVANAAIFSTALDITDAANALAGEGFPVDTGDLAAVSPYIMRTIRRFGSWVVDLTPPDRAPATRLDLEPRVLFRV